MKHGKPHKKIDRDALKDIRILVVDSDMHMSHVLVRNLEVMGFRHTVHAASGNEALEVLKKKPFDILITEWVMAPVEGIELVRQLRMNGNSPARTIPIIMLTGKGEKPDVEVARDAGITEFLVKPFNSQTVFGRLEQLVDHPREFLLAPTYVGPERRRRKSNAAGGGERRTTEPIPVRALDQKLHQAPAAPLILPPDFTLKRKIVLAEPLGAIITLQVLQEAQAAIDGLRDESLVWLRDDMKVMEQAYARLKENGLIALKVLKDTALSIKSRAGTFHFSVMSEIARLLYRFISGDYKPNTPQHNTVVLKHIEALKVIFARSLKDKDDSIGQELVKELQLLVAKYRV